MTVGELKEALDKYDDDTDVYVTIMGCTKVFRPKLDEWIGYPEITSDDEPDFDDCIEIARMCLKYNERLEPEQREILECLTE